MSNEVEASQKGIGVIPVLSIMTVIFFVSRLYGGDPSAWYIGGVAAGLSIASYFGSGQQLWVHFVRGVMTIALCLFIAHTADWLAIMASRHLFS